VQQINVRSPKRIQYEGILLPEMQPGIRGRRRWRYWVRQPVEAHGEKGALFEKGGQEMKSLFGDEIHDVPARLRKDNAHAAPVGTGPQGKQCKDCAHSRRTGRPGSWYFKCWLMHNHWTRGPGSDIRLKDAACRYFKEQDITACPAQ